MAVTSAPSRRRHSAESLLGREWNRLSDLVAQYRPDLVVLIARKMPRISELLDLRYATRDRVVSDLAIPFMHSSFRNARVAIVDDIVNVGSTLCRAADAVRAAGARELKLFALAQRCRADERNIAVQCVREEALTDDAYARFVESVPAALQYLSKPYDIEFPVLSCRLSTFDSTVNDVVLKLQRCVGAGAVSIIRPLSFSDGLHRISIRGSSVGFNDTQFRLYVDTTTGTCEVVGCVDGKLSVTPLSLVHPAPRALFSALCDLIGDAPAETSTWPAEGRHRAGSFCAAYDRCLSFLSRVSGVFDLTSEIVLSLRDMHFLFGNKLGQLAPVRVLPNGPHAQYELSAPNYSGKSQFPELIGFGHVVPHLTHFFAANVPELCAHFFEILARVVGASDTEGYILSWPFSKSEISSNPYLRLRIGPTLDDLVLCLKDELERRWPSIDVHSAVLSALHYLIDQGAIVPTIGNYNEEFFRIYRKGEGDYRDLTAQRVLFAIHNCEEPLTLFRITKIAATLAFSASDNAPDGIWLGAMQHGNVATFKGTAIDGSGTEIAEYLRDTRALVRVNRQS